MGKIGRKKREQSGRGGASVPKKDFEIVDRGAVAGVFAEVICAL